MPAAVTGLRGSLLMGSLLFAGVLLVVKGKLDVVLLHPSVGLPRLLGTSSAM